MRHYFADLHIHIGRTISGKPVKISAANSLTLEAILDYASRIKGIQMVGVIDCHNLEVIEEIRKKLQSNHGAPHPDGGILFSNGVTLIPGVEFEVKDENCHGPIHVLGFFPHLDKIEQFANWLQKRVKNPSLSSQRVYEKGKVIQQKIKELDGLFIPAHIFTPYKSVYGSGVKRSIAEVFDPTFIDGVELGLSSNTKMADEIKELHGFSYLSNSDAHSLEKIAREYQIIKMEEPSFLELKKALHLQEGRKIIGNYGLDPKLGKYYYSSCEKCTQPVSDEKNECIHCGHKRIVKGVYQRIKEVSKQSNRSLSRKKRPPYIHQIPLEFIPTLGPKTLAKLRQKFGTDMYVIHQTEKEQLLVIVKESIAEAIIKGREGKLSIEKGGAGRYGKIKRD